MASGLELRVLGPLELIRDGAAVGLGGVKPRMLLGTLALNHGRAVSVDQLIEVLWPGDPPKSATANVQTYVSSLRSLLGQNRLVTKAPGTVHRIRGDLDQAHHCFRQVLASYVEAADLHGQAFAHGSLGQALLARGELDEAVRALDKGLALAAQVGDNHRLAHLTHIVARVFVRKGDPALARSRLALALDLFISLGDAHGQAYTSMDLADLEPTDLAVARLTDALEILDRMGDRQAQANCSRRLGELHRQAGRSGLGGAYLDEAIRLHTHLSR